MIKLDSVYAHAEINVPALTLIHDSRYREAEREFTEALRHLRESQWSEAIVNANSALESVLKTIIDKRGWTLPPKNQMGGLLNEVLGRGLVPAVMQNHFHNLKDVILSGAPTIRNQGGGGHGAAVTGVVMTQSLAYFVVNSVATAILLFVEAERDMG